MKKQLKIIDEYNIGDIVYIPDMKAKGIVKDVLTDFLQIEIENYKYDNPAYPYHNIYG